MEKQRDKAAKRMQRKLGETTPGASDELMADGEAAGPPIDDLGPAGDDLGPSGDDLGHTVDALEKAN